jgi:erythromycin esterase
MEQVPAHVSKAEESPLTNSKSLDILLDRIGDAPYVLLGEASHGTHEYYTWRTAISKRLIEEKGFRFIAVEGDWPDCYRLNRYIKGYDDQDKSAPEVLAGFKRWPTWMWANWEIAALTMWLKDFNETRPANLRAGFYGLDVYSLWESMEALMNYLDKTDRETLKTARKAMECFQRFGVNEHLYADHSLTASCRDEASRLLSQIRLKAASYDQDPEASLNTEQNALVAVDAEKYYRSMLSFDDKSWNIRDTHMAETFYRLLKFHGEKTKAIIWAHNTHIGDARYTDMKRAGMINLGQLLRQQYSEKEVVLVGFGSYEGKVIAGKSWGAQVEEMNVPPAKTGSLEDKLHHESMQDRTLIFEGAMKNKYETVLPHRAIGVVYHPEFERRGNYVPSLMSLRYDAFLYIDKTTALHPIGIKPNLSEVPGTYPFTF